MDMPGWRLVCGVKYWHRLLPCGLLWCGLAEVSHAAVLIPTETTWRWRPGTNEASVPVDLWRRVDFADTQFSAAPAPFWYGDTMPGGTRITGMQNVYRCIFLRKTFLVSTPSEIGGLRLSSVVDDGFVAWINGTEVLRINMREGPGTAVSTSTLAQNADEPVAFTTRDLPAPASYLRAGTNVLAVQVFQSALNSSDLGFDCALESIVRETVPPVVAGVVPAPGTITELSEVTVTFSEPVTGVTAAHLLVNGIGASTLAVVDSATYRFGFVPPAYGTVAMSWHADHNIYDQAQPPNRFDGTGAGATWYYELVDRAPPVVAAVSPAANLTVRSLTSVTVLFSEAVAGVDAADLLVNARPAVSVTPAGPSQYIFAFPQPATGMVQVAWAGSHGIGDLATPPNVFGGGDWVYRLDPNAAEAAPYISEFMASNTRGLADETGARSDWIEIYNPSSAAVNLEGWSLTDDPDDPGKWRFPATNLAGGAFLVVFASGEDRRVPGARLHTSFQIAAGGEYLALVRPDGVTRTSEFAPEFPQQVPDVSYGVAQSGPPPEYVLSAGAVYFTAPTPGAVNWGGSAVPGPIIESVQHSPTVPRDWEDLVVTARVLPSFGAVGSVTLQYRIMFNDELSMPMRDDGAHGDGGIGDGVYGAVVAADLSTNGQMIRYSVRAADASGAGSRWPLFTDPAATEEYLGTIVDPTNLTSRLPIFHLFVAPGQLGRIDTESGGRVAFFYDGEFYDNVYMELRGNTSAGLSKKTHRLEFNRGHELRHAGPGGRSRRSSLLAEYLDPAYMRQHLCFWFLNAIGVPAPYDYPVRVQMNGSFYQLAFHSDVIGKEQVERMGYDPTGALYKAVGNLVPSFSSTGVFQKLEPEDDPSRTDYLELANGINEAAALDVRRATVFDLLDLPQVINHLAGSRWCAENDDVWANMSLYRDTYGDGRWRCIPFDMNASWGQLYGGSNPLEATADGSKSHPLYGGSSTGGNFNRLYDVIVTLPETRQMLLRRERSILDLMVQPPGTPATARVIETYVHSMSNLLSAEAILDRARWGYSPWASGKTFAQGVADLVTQFVGPRRQHWYVTHCITNTSRTLGTGNANNAGIPLAQPPNLAIAVVGVDSSPAGGNQAQEYICLSNTAPYAVDLTGWQLAGAVDFAFAPGTVVPSNSVCYVSPDTRAFRARTAGPRGGQGRFVVGPYRGQLSARGEAIEVRDPFGQTLGTFGYAGTPSPVQQYLRITEIQYHPAAPEGSVIPADEFEYAELRNLSTATTLDLNGVRLVEGIEFDFTGSAVASLAPGARVLVVKNTVAFSARHGDALPVAGQFTGNLDNAGERIRLLDAANEEVLDFEYDDDWHPITDGLGFALVVREEAAAPDAWGQAAQWRPSVLPWGSPGADEPPQWTLPPVLITEALTRKDTPPPVDSIEVHNPTESAADIGGWWLTDDFNTPAKFRIPGGTVIPARGYRVFDASQFNVGDTAFGLGADGDEVWLFSADALGNLTGYVHGHRFGAAEDGVSFGRHVTSDGVEHFVAQSARSLGADNTGPRVGSVVINEILYHPADSAGATDDDTGEYIELLNATDGPVALFDPDRPANTWRVSGGVDFELPTGVTLAGGETILLVSFSPTDAAVADAFRARHGVPVDARLFGPYAGKLSNSGEEIQLQRPTVLGPEAPGYVVVDEVDYRDTRPWPEGADGLGLSLQRCVPEAYGNDPANWVAAPPTAAARTATGVAPAITGHPRSQSLIAYQSVSFSVSATGDPPLCYQWRRNGAPLAGATNALLRLDRARPEQAGVYDVLAYNGAGSAMSSNAVLALAYPAAILAEPQSVATRAGGTVTFSVLAYSSGAMTYQWRRNGADIPGARGSSLNVRNVQYADGGDYTVVITDPVGPVVSAPATLTVLIDPTLVRHPLGQEVVPGAAVVFSVSVTNTATLPIGWRMYRNGAAVPASVPGAFVTLDEHTAYFALSGASTMPPYNNYSFLVTNVAKPEGIMTASAVLTYVTDSDGDGLGDSWEAIFFGAPGTTPQDDPDGDGSNNRDEHGAGTNPTDPASHLQIDALTAFPDWTITFEAAAKRTYSVEFNDHLGAAPWQKLADVPALGVPRVVSVPDPGGVPHRAYRLVTPRQP